MSARANLRKIDEEDKVSLHFPIISYHFSFFENDSFEQMFLEQMLFEIR
jgi:hypothetical protein